MDTLELIPSPTFRLEDFWVPEGAEGTSPAKAQQMTLLDFECFEIPPAKIVLAMSRHRMHDTGFFATSITVLFNRRFWVIQLELEEHELVGEHEGAVVRHLLDEPPKFEDADREFDPYGPSLGRSHSG